MSNDYTVLPSGRRVYANSGYIGINEDLETAGGYDNGLEVPTPMYMIEHTPENQILTLQDALALADLMILRWQAWKYKMQTEDSE